MGFSVEVNEPFLGWTEIIEFTLVDKIPKESTEKLKDRNERSVEVIMGNPRYQRGNSRLLSVCHVSGPA